MKTFFAFTTGALTGLIGGVLLTELLFCDNEHFREYLNDEAKSWKK